jgi:hypothetical protein
MKKIAILTLMAALSFSYWSCSNEFELIDTYKDIPVVYAIVNRSDTAHYFRVERVFVDAKKGAPEVAQIPDSLYYDPSVEVLAYKGNNPTPIKMKRVDGNLEGYKRTTGLYAQTPNILYKVKASVAQFAPNEIVKVVVRRKDGTVITEGSAQILDDLILDVPNLKKNNTLYFDSKSSFSIAIRANLNQARTYDVRLVMNIDEQDPANPTKYLPKRLEWFLERGYVPSPNLKDIQLLTFRKNGLDFFKFLGDNLQANGRKRIFKSMDVVVDASGLDLEKYINATNANTGITGTEVLPNYTNLTKGYGLVSSRINLTGKPVYYDDKNNALDSLRYGQFTKKLLFQ